MDNCIFCRIIAGEIPSMRVYEDECCIAMLDINPAGPGHTLILPKQHFQDITAVDDATVGHLFSVARKIADLYGGRILLESQPGEGTRVTVRLPIRQARDTVVHVMPGDYQLSGMNPVLMELSDALPYTCYTEQYMD